MDGLRFEWDKRKATANARKHGVGDRPVPFDAAVQIDRAIDQHTRLRQLLGPDVALMCDAAGMFSPSQAHRLIEALRPLDMHFVEEPTNMDTIEPTLRLKRDFPDVPIAGDSSSALRAHGS